jgi:hypothetical protein
MTIEELKVENKRLNRRVKFLEHVLKETLKTATFPKGGRCYTALNVSPKERIIRALLWKDEENDE